MADDKHDNNEGKPEKALYRESHYETALRLANGGKAITDNVQRDCVTTQDYYNKVMYQDEVINDAGNTAISDQSSSFVKEHELMDNNLLLESEPSDSELMGSIQDAPEDLKQTQRETIPVLSKNTQMFTQTDPFTNEQTVNEVLDKRLKVEDFDHESPLTDHFFDKSDEESQNFDKQLSSIDEEIYESEAAFVDTKQWQAGTNDLFNDEPSTESRKLESVLSSIDDELTDSDETSVDLDKLNDELINR